MFPRIAPITTNNSFFLFGPRGTGKSTLLQSTFKAIPCLWIDLLDPDQEQEYTVYPKRILEKWQAMKPTPKWIIIDEVQKLPKLLDIVHYAIEKYNIWFALTGSSSRKLKSHATNLLAGRAFVHHLHPLTHLELSESFQLQDALQWGTLPKIYSLEHAIDKKRFLRAYTQTYLKEEIQMEQIVRKMEPFRKFIEVAAQSTTEILNFSKLAREAMIEAKSTQRYFDILSDTYLGFYLDARHPSIRKRQLLKPKFYFFDTGVCRAAQNLLDADVHPHTYAFGKLFENFIVTECFRLNDYFETNFTLSYMHTKDNMEIDLILDKPQEKTIFIEIKSTDRVDPTAIRALKQVQKELPNEIFMVLSLEKEPRCLDGILIIPWQQGLRRIFIERGSRGIDSSP